MRNPLIEKATHAVGEIRYYGEAKNPKTTYSDQANGKPQVPLEANTQTGKRVPEPTRLLTSRKEEKGDQTRTQVYYKHRKCQTPITHENAKIDHI